MSAYLPEEKILFSGDFFGAHYASSSLYADYRPEVVEAAKLYYAHVMMPFRRVVQNNLDKIAPLPFEIIASCHGPLHNNPGILLSAYREWVDEKTKNSVVIPYVSMHGSTALMVDRLVERLCDAGVQVHLFEMGTTDLGKLAVALVDAATVFFETPTVNAGPHPSIFAATSLINALRPKLRSVGIVGSFG